LKVLSAELKVLSGVNVMIDARYRLFHGDCLEILPTLPARSVDAVICDPPYGTTACAWDSVIPLEPMWAAIRHVLKSCGAVVLFGSQPFTSALVMSNPKFFKYCWVWDKKLTVNFLNAHKQPLRQTEDIVVFYKEQCTYNPQLETRGLPRNKGGYNKPNGSENYGIYHNVDSFNNIYHPTNLIKISNAQQVGKLHPTQKPVALMEYLIRTYTNEGDVVLDFTMGSGTTGVAAMNTGRRFVGVEMDAGYYAIAQERIGNAAGDYRPTAKEEARGMKALFW
jgi:site-specific DNA-methyltransferase (adenine-specific)